MFIYRLYETGKDTLLAVCDARIRGKLLRERPRFEVGEFYGESETGAEIVEIARRASSVNAVGNEIVGLLEREGIVEPSGVVVIGGEKHAIVVRI